jgi:hypothetical protein
MVGVMTASLPLPGLAKLQVDAGEGEAVEEVILRLWLRAVLIRYARSKKSTLPFLCLRHGRCVSG